MCTAPSLCPAAWLSGAGLKISPSLEERALNQAVPGVPGPPLMGSPQDLWISPFHGARSLYSDGEVLQLPLRSDLAGEVGSAGQWSEVKAASGSFGRPRGHLFPR